MENKKSQSRKFTAWEDLTLSSNFLFCKIMESEPDLCKHLIEILLHIEIDHLEKPQMERTFKEGINSKGVRFDVFTKDRERIFDVEIQTEDRPNLPRRARYYQGIIDVDHLKAGMNYSELKDTYVIFICMRDPFSKGLPVYSFENVCRENCETKLCDGSYKVFFNAEKSDRLISEAEKKFFSFLKNNTAGDDFTRALENRVRRAKEDEELRRAYMTWEQEIADQRYWAKKEGLQQGLQQKAIEDARNALNMGLSIEQAAQITFLPLDEVRAIALELEKETVQP